MVQTVSRSMQVNPASGRDDRPGGPYQTLAHALQQATAGTLIQLAAGTYSQASGERFPLLVPDGVLLLGDESTQGTAIVIHGGGPHHSPSQGEQTVTLILAGSAQLRGVTVTNPRAGGIGLWIEQGAPLVSRCRLRQCGHGGGQILAQARPTIVDTLIEANGTVGLQWQGHAKGEVQRCQCRQSGQALSILGAAAPLLSALHCSGNRVGCRIGATARPVLRQTRLDNNEIGLWVDAEALPDLGHPQDDGGNVWRHNRQADLRNDTARRLQSVGNDVVPQGLVGAVALVASQRPDPVAVPPPLGQAPPTPDSPPASPAPPPATPSPQGSRFRDMAGHWAAPFVEGLAQRGLVKGFIDGRFRPDQQVTRAQFAALTVASFANNATTTRKTSAPFQDLPPQHWAAAAIATAQDQGFLSGYPDGTVRPDQPMTRVQALVALANGLGLPSTAIPVTYRDRAQIPSYAVGPVAAATQQGLVVNYPHPQELRPMAPITSAEVAALVYQGLVNQGQATVMTSPYVVAATADWPRFTDVAHHWAAAFIEPLADRGLIQGYADGRFQPDQPMTRAQFAAMLTQAFHPISPATARGFPGRAPRLLGADAIQTAYRAGFMAGFPDHTFGPNHPLLRVQVLVSLVNGLFSAAATADSQQWQHYQDADAIPAYARQAIAQATGLGLVVTHSRSTAMPPQPRCQPGRGGRHGASSPGSPGAPGPGGVSLYCHSHWRRRIGERWAYRVVGGVRVSQAT
ncbi:Cell surface glycoprotein 2 [Halomicronema hongdechloris C2206]|uniref:Cell surface glycoprotein 2 n=1 Tax=Halomicronema hongdechloris C2206 TaxID=1641165 RepID=A0A1Z3HN41_9CYAN|nr:S-layer homology domain-containing protein [Halomicronema hongdechloris]ASC71734.1 Cell surface glycoprotein 2 [Halomicronema hongdechloris C2206]